jgi:CheY-like chemotaxis protein
MPRTSHSNHDGPAPKGRATPCGGRLNLLLSYAGWDHESWVDRLPRLLEPMGVVALRAGTGREASEVLRHNPIHIAVVDLGLPLDEPCSKTPALDSPDMEEGGSRLLDLLGRLAEPPPTVVVKRGRTHRDDSREIAAALRAGAFAVVDRPHGLPDLEVMLEVLRRCMDRFYKSRWPGTT